MKFKIPPSISIGGVEYEIIYTKDPPLFDKENDIANVGQIDLLKSVIRIWEGLSDEMQLLTLVHEIQHGVEFVFAINPGDSIMHSEEYVEMTANIWLQVIKQIVEWNIMCNSKSMFDDRAEIKEIKDF